MNPIWLSQFLATLILFEMQKNVSADENTYPFLVKIKIKGKLLDCAGTILTPCIVLTSAYCVEDAKPRDVTVTSTSMVEYETIAITVHPGNDNMTMRHELALVQTKENFQKPPTGVHISSVDDKILNQCNFFQMFTWADRDIGNEITARPINKTVRLISNESCRNLIKNFRGVLEGEEKICAVTTEEDKEEGRGCFISLGGPLMCYNPPRKLSEKEKTKALRNVNYWKENETLAEPIDLLEISRKSSRRIEPEMRISLLGVLIRGKGCSGDAGVYVRTDLYYDWISETAKRMKRKFGASPEDFRFLTELTSEAARLLFSNTSKFMVFLSIYYFSLLVL